MKVQKDIYLISNRNPGCILFVEQFYEFYHNEVATQTKMFNEYKGVKLSVISVLGVVGLGMVMPEQFIEI